MSKETKKTKKTTAKKSASAKNKSKAKLAKTSSAKKTTKKVSKPLKTTKKSSPKKSTKKVSKSNSKISKKTKSTSVNKSKKVNNRKSTQQPRIVKINKKFVKLPKRTNLEIYSCVWRMYLVTNPKTKKQTVQKFWIVIGKGHKKYRKFETQVEAIQYFRALKKYARMSVQSVKSKEFIRNVYTFFEMAWRGVELDTIKKSTRKISNDEDYVDQFDDVNIDDDDKIENFDDEEINKIIAENEGGVLVDEVNSKLSSSTEVETPKENEFVTQVIGLNSDEETKVEESDPYALTTEISFVEESKPEADPYALTNEVHLENLPEVIIEPVKEEHIEEVVEQPQPAAQPVAPAPVVIEESKPEVVDPYALTNEITPTTSLYDLSISEEEQLNENELVQPSSNDKVHETINDENINLTQYQTSLVSANKSESIDGRYSSRLRITYWLLIILIALALAAIVVIAMLFVTNIL